MFVRVNWGIVSCAIPPTMGSIDWAELIGLWFLIGKLKLASQSGIKEWLLLFSWPSGMIRA